MNTITARTHLGLNRKLYNVMKYLGLRGLAVACCTTDYYHPCSNLGVGISEGCFIFDFASLRLEVVRPI